jgi:hypothetical protein
MRTLLLCFAFLLGFAAPSFAQPSNDGAALYGPWRGIWTGAGQPQSIYQGEMSLALGAGNRVTGQVNWMLVQAPSPDLQAKIGARGVEYVEGVFDPETRSIALEGVRLDDPSQILGTDVYRLVIADSNAVIVGLTRDGDSWTGRLEMSR